MKSKDYQQLERQIAESKAKLRDDPSDLDALFSLGFALRSLGRHDEASQVYETMLKHVPGDHEVMHAYGRNLFEIGKVGEAVSWLNRATQLWKKEPLYFADLGDALRAANQPAEAKVAYEAGLAIALPNEETVDRLRRGLDSL